MKLTIDCPHGQYRDKMRIYCTKIDGWCGNVYYKSCKGWWVLNEAASKCPIRKRDEK